MDAALSLALVAAVLSLCAAAMAARLSRAPGWAEQKWFGILSLVAAAWAAAGLLSRLPTAGDQAVTALWRGRLALAAVQAGIWLRYSDVQLRAPRGIHDRLAAAAVVAGLAGMIPGAALTGRVSHVAFGSAGPRVAQPTLFGWALAGATALTLAAVTVRFALAARRGAAHAWLPAAGLAALTAAAASDGLAAVGLVRMPPLGDLGIVAAVGAVSLALAGRFVDEAWVLHGLRNRLEQAVAERTGALAAREAELTRAEHLAALGRLAAGVAHEIAGPAAAAASNVRTLARDMRAGELPPDALECLEESEEALARITRTLRMLHDAERVAAAPGGSGVVSLSKALEEVVGGGRMRGNGDEVATEVPDALSVKGEWRVVVEVLTLVLAQVRQGGAGGTCRVTVRARPAGDQVRLEVERAAAPGAWSPAAAPGDGQGLAVARGLAGSLGGSLEAEVGAGGQMRVVLELPAGYT